jgi:hypothetical protein
LPPPANPASPLRSRRLQAGALLARPDGSLAVSLPHTTSSWLAERELLMCEFGEFSVSGLVLADAE